MIRRPAALLLLALAGPLAAQVRPAPGDSLGGGLPGDSIPGAPIPDLSLLPAAPGATMGMKLEKTIFKVDVLRLDLRIDPETAAALRATVEAWGARDESPGDTVATLVVRAREAVARIEFLREIDLPRFLDAVDEDMRHAVEAGWLEPESYRRVRDGLPVWFGFLAGRRIRDGDRLSYHVRGDTLRTVFSDREGTVLLDQTDVGRQNVVALLGAYFAPGSSFRKGLIESLIESLTESLRKRPGLRPPRPSAS